MRRAMSWMGLAVAVVNVLPLTAQAPAPVRPAADTARDAARKPAEMVAFAQVKPGQTVVDMMPGQGYFTRVFAGAVGPKGRVIALVPKLLVEHKPDAADAVNALAAEPGRGNVRVAVQSLATIAPPGSVDVVWTARNYHDLKLPFLPADTTAGVNRAVFAALKPGGHYVVIDHSAAAGSGARDAGTLHRIDPALVKQEVLAAGFVLDGESRALANPADDHTRKVFDPAMKDRTDQFALRFRKPG